MTEASQHAVKMAMESLIAQDIQKAEEIISNDRKINELEDKINDMAISLIAMQSPVATDLRKIIAALRISSEVERIGDMAVNIAKSTLHIGTEKHIKEIVDIPKMMDMALEMLTDALTSFYTEDAALAKKCTEKDDAVDEMYGKLVKELLSYIPQNPAATNQIAQLAFVCRFIERVADHSTNIAEYVIYLVTGKRYDLNA